MGRCVQGYADPLALTAIAKVDARTGLLTFSKNVSLPAVEARHGSLSGSGIRGRSSANSSEAQVKGVLYLTRKIGETIVINDDIRVTVVEIRGKSIKLGFTFPSDVSVLREELYERIQAENRAAAESAGEVFKGLTATKNETGD